MRAAERTSDLQPALARYVAYQAQVEALKRRVVHASIYPALLVGVGALVSFFLLLYVVPRFSLIYEDRAVDLPLLSRLLLSWGQLVEHHGMVIVIALFAVLIFVDLVRCACRRPGRRFKTCCGACRARASA